MKSAKNAFYKKGAPKLIFFNVIFFRKIRMIFDIENSLWKSKIGTFWQSVTRWRLKIWYFHLNTVDSWPKTLLMPSAPSWNSTTETHLNYIVFAYMDFIWPLRKHWLQIQLWKYLLRLIHLNVKWKRHHNLLYNFYWHLWYWNGCTYTIQCHLYNKKEA